MAVRIVVQAALKTQEIVIGAVFRTGPQENKLASVCKGVENSVSDESHALLMIQPSDVGNNWLIRGFQEEPVPERIFVLIFSLKAADAVIVRDVSVDLGIPYVVINAVQYPSEFVSVHM